MSGHKQRRRSAKVGMAPPQENSLALGVTVSWMMSALSAAVADVGALLSWSLANWLPGPYPAAFQSIGLFTGVVAGVMAAILCVVARYVRVTPAPRSVVVTSWVITAVSIGLALTL